MEDSYVTAKIIVVSLCFSSSSRSDTERNAGSEPRPVPRGPAVASHAHWDDSGCEVRGPAGQRPPEQREERCASHGATWGLGTSLCVIRAEIAWVSEGVKGAPEDPVQVPASPSQAVKLPWSLCRCDEAEWQ